MGGRGTSSGFGIVPQLKQAIKKNDFPVSIAGNPDYQSAVLRAINTVYDYPADLKQYMASNFANGYPHVRVGQVMQDKHDPQREFLNISVGGSSTLRVSYQTGNSAADTDAIRQGAIKFSLINWWRNEGHALKFH